VEAEFVLRVQVPEAIHKLAAKHFPENIDRQEELLLRVDPSGVIRRQSSGGHDTVGMGMVLEFLIPGVENAEEPDLGAEPPGVAGDLKQGVGAGPEQQGIDFAFVLQRQWRKLPRQSKDYVDVAGRQQFFPPRLEPAVAGISLTFWAVAVSARVE
jgi:hypothetical protein